MVGGHERRKMIGKGLRWEVKVGDRGEDIGGCSIRGEERGLG